MPLAVKCDVESSLRIVVRPRHCQREGLAWTLETLILWPLCPIIDATMREVLVNSIFYLWHEDRGIA